MDNVEAVITMADEIPLILAVVDKNTGLPVPNAAISEIKWSVDANIGEIVPDPSNVNGAIFKPSGTGVVHISATATVTIP